MFVRISKSKNSPRVSVKIVHNVREGDKVKQIMIENLGVAQDEQHLEMLKKLGARRIQERLIAKEKEEKKAKLPFYNEQTDINNALQAYHVAKGRKERKKLADILPTHQVTLDQIVEERRIIEGVHDVFVPLFQRLGYDTLLPNKIDQKRLLDLVLSRIVNPTSKHQTQHHLARHFGIYHDLDSLYRTLDKLHPHIHTLKCKTFAHTKALVGQANIVLFDVTTLSFESTEEDDLRAFGYSKDFKFNTTQVVLALATNQEGLPVGYELFKGNQAEVGTLVACIESWQKDFPIQKVTFVADRAMMSAQNLKLLEEKGYSYIVACKLKTLPNAMKQNILNRNNYASVDGAKHTGSNLDPHEGSYKIACFKIEAEAHAQNQRSIIVSDCPDRARRDSKKRQEIIDKLSEKADGQGIIQTKKLMGNQGIKSVTKTEQSQTVLDHKKIQDLEKWDGLHGVITNIVHQKPAEILAQYGALWKIEESFRINKHTLSMRPIYHFKKERIESHIAICYMAFSLVRVLEYLLKLTQKISINTVIEELLSVQSSIYVHKETKDLYKLPGKFSHVAAKIYKAVGLKRNLNAQIYTP